MPSAGSYGGGAWGGAVLGAVVAGLALDPGVVGDVDDDQAADGLDGRLDDDDLVGLVAVPRVALVDRGALGGARREQRVPAGAADPGHAVAVDEDGGPGLEDGLEGGGAAVAEAVVGHAGVGAEHDGGEAAQEVGDLLRLDPGGLGEGTGLGAVLGEGVELLFHVAAAEPLGSSVQAGGGRVDGADALAGRIGQRGLNGGRTRGWRRRR
ncbi:hypothetical protein GCM10020254_16600 [Streptomyces goshikiensis]